MFVWHERLSNPALILAVAAVCSAAHTAAQGHLSTPRSDGQATPLVLYPAIGAAASCPPLTVISHGAGGSENGYAYLGRAMSNLGYTTVVMGHAESGLGPLEDDMRRFGVMQGLADLVADPNAEQARLLDVGAALQWADGRCHPPFRVLLGHSMGAETVMLESGAKNILGVASPPASQNRFDAYVALSPEGPGIVFPADAWSGIRKPMLILTGTRDQSLQGGPQARLLPWNDLPGIESRCHWLGVIDGATHMNFAGNGFGYQKVVPMVTQTIAAFLEGARKDSCTPPMPIAGMTLQAK